MRHICYCFLLLMALSVGCSKNESPSAKPLDPALQPFEDAFEVLATSSDQNQINDSKAKIESGGVNALRLLCTHLNDERTPVGKLDSKKSRGRADMGMHAYWMIQRMVEEPGKEFYSSAYGAFSMSTVEAWLSERFEKPMIDIKLDAAKASLAIAEKELANEPNKESQPAVDRFKKIVERLKTEKTQSSEGKSPSSE